MKKNILKPLVIVFTAVFLITALTGFKFFQKTPWNVPAAAKNKVNPIPSNSESLATGKSLWATHCKSCHGVKGKGDGPKAAQLKTDPGDFSKAEEQSQSDGSLFYKTSEGREDMPKFKSKIPDPDDIWSIVNYIRTMK
ncbi:MAG: c-type cytochrome [Chitinophagaceae bacterium]